MSFATATASFVSKGHALRWYQRNVYSLIILADITDKLREGLIRIGRPECPEGCRVYAEGGQYFIAPRRSREAV